jgi:hypothetical protein
MPVADAWRPRRDELSFESLLIPLVPVEEDVKQ